ncbi:MAG: HEAT repeat domain-containing protein [Firmicutes bacterium]|nr:HEAT repeat domain-containing protein [Bacillota bacterium]
MKRFHRICIFILAIVFLLPLGGCQAKAAPDYSEGDAAQFVKNVAKAITSGVDSADLFYSEVSILYDLEQVPVLQPHFFITYVKAETDPSDPSLVHYSCHIPGAVNISFQMAYNVYFSDIYKYSQFVKVEGDLRVVTDENGKRQIDITQGDNPFAVYAEMRYVSPLVLSTKNIVLSDGISEVERSDLLNLLLNLSCSAYGEMLGISADEYADQTVVPELEKVTVNFSTVYKGRKSNNSIQDTSFISLYSTSSSLGRIGLILGFCIAILGPVALILWLGYGEGPRAFFRRLRAPSLARTGRGNHSEVTEAIRSLDYPKDLKLLKKIVVDQKRYGGDRVTALRRLPYPEERDLLVQLLEDKNANCAETALDKLPYPEEKEILKKQAINAASSSVRYAAIRKLPYPQEKETLIQVALNDHESDNRLKVVRELKYPEDSEWLKRIISQDSNDQIRIACIEKLAYPKEKDILKNLALKGRSSRERLAAIDKLSYPEEKDTLLNVALHEENDYNRLKAVRQLTYPEDAKWLKKFAFEDADKEIQLTCMKKLPYPQEKEIFERAALNGENAIRRIALEKLTYQDSKDTLLKAAETETDEELLALIRSRISYLDETKAFVESVLKDKDPSTQDLLKASISLSRHPYSSEKIIRHLCLSIQKGMITSADQDAVSLAGWSAAALGKVLTADFHPEQIPSNEKRFELAIDRYNDLVGKIQEVQVHLRPFEGQRLDYLKYDDRDNVREWMRQIEGYQEELNLGLGIFMMDNQDQPFSYLKHLLNDRTSRIPRFIKQGVIMGLLDWLLQNQDQSDAVKLLEEVVAVRKELIQTDNELSFFEVRVPEDTIPDDYADILAEVLHAANPSVAFCDTHKLIEIAREEVPGCLDMLNKCPLRLIDPVEQQTLGFVKFQPYLHMIWVQFQPPKDIGKVISRYHEVDDRTRPLSSGLSIRLFLDPYAVIPTVFHEYQHFSGDRNEASVFLKTQVFSIRFYKKYRQANARRDVVFAQMTSMLGMPPDVSKISVLNDKIRECYGEQVSKETAKKHADEEINKLNGMIRYRNMTETWDPSVKYPLFTDDEDKKNRDIIHSVIISFQSAPKSITEDEFTKIVGQ